MLFLCEMFCEIVFDFADCKHPKTAEDFLKSTPSKVCSHGLFECFLGYFSVVWLPRKWRKIMKKIEILNLGLIL